MQDPPEDSTGFNVKSVSGASRKRVVRRVTRAKGSEESSPPALPIVNEKKIEEPIRIEARSSVIFRCLKCATLVPAGSERCPKCGIAYIREELTAEAEEAEIDAELAFDDSFEDVSPLFEQDELACGYFDVDNGIVAYVKSRHGSREAVYECLNCKTILEFEVEKCPFCREPLKKIDEGIVGIVNGAIVGKDLDMEISKDVFCPICGDLLALDGGHCIVCETELVSSSNESLSSLLPVVSSGNLIFLHLDVENGDLNYLSDCKESPEETTPGPPPEDSLNDDISIWLDDSENNQTLNDKEGRLS